MFYAKVLGTLYQMIPEENVECSKVGSRHSPSQLAGMVTGENGKLHGQPVALGGLATKSTWLSLELYEITARSKHPAT